VFSFSIAATVEV